MLGHLKASDIWAWHASNEKFLLLELNETIDGNFNFKTWFMINDSFSAITQILRDYVILNIL